MRSIVLLSNFFSPIWEQKNFYSVLISVVSILEMASNSTLLTSPPQSSIFFAGKVLPKERTQTRNRAQSGRNSFALSRAIFRYPPQCSGKWKRRLSQLVNPIIVSFAAIRQARNLVDGSQLAARIEGGLHNNAN